MSELKADTIVSVVRRLVGEASPVGEHGRDAVRLGHTKTLSAVVLDLLEVLVDLSKSNHSHEASVSAIGKYAADTIGIINEHTGAWDELERLRGLLREAYDNCEQCRGESDPSRRCARCLVFAAELAKEKP